MWSGRVFKVVLLTSRGKHDATPLLLYGKCGWPMCSRAAEGRIVAGCQYGVALHCTAATGFEPLRAEPCGFSIHHPHHSVTLS